MVSFRENEEVQQVIEKHLHIYVWDKCLSAHFPDIKVNILKYDRRSTKPFATYIMLWGNTTSINSSVRAGHKCKESNSISGSCDSSFTE